MKARKHTTVKCAFLRSLFVLLMVAAMGTCAHAAAETAPELSTACTYSAGKKHTPFSRLTDGSYQSAFTSNDGTLVVTAPKGQSISRLYLCFADIPAQWALEKQAENGWETVYDGGATYPHQVYDVPGLTHVRIVAKGEALSLSELRVFGAGELPGDVQQWQPTPEKADLLLLVAHPDDEFLFFGGLIPYYASQQKHVLVAYMTCRSDVRRAELLNGLWTAGIREYPVIGTFRDRYTRTLSDMYNLWTRESTDSFVIKLMRRFKPDVFVTHHTGGEYGHGAHRACADAALRMFDKAADPLYMPQHAQKYGVWQPKKLYLHLYEQNPLTMDWSRPVGEQTALSVAEEAFKMHVSQQHFHMQYGEGSNYNNALFGLAKTTVGEDIKKDDFFENLQSANATGNGKPN